MRYGFEPRQLRWDLHGFRKTGRWQWKIIRLPLLGKPSAPSPIPDHPSPLLSMRRHIDDPYRDHEDHGLYHHAHLVDQLRLPVIIQHVFLVHGPLDDHLHHG